jgi:hypothetical protein
VPAFADPAAEPEWETVAVNGRYAWHDHRTHWMNSVRPPGAEPGDQILEAVIPIDMEGERIDITVISSLQGDPDPLFAVLAAVAGIALSAVVLRATLRTGAAVAAAVALLGSVVGAVAVLSVPSETEPSATLWLPPAIAVGTALGVLLARPSTRPSLLGIGLLGVAGVQLVLWAVLSRTMVTKPILPTEFPWAGVRTVVVVAGLVGVAISIRFLIAITSIFRASRLPELAS